MYGMAKEAKALAHRDVKPEDGGNMRHRSSVAAAWGDPLRRPPAANGPLAASLCHWRQPTHPVVCLWRQAGLWRQELLS